MFHSYLQHTTHMIIFSRLQVVNQNITIHPSQTRLQGFNFILARLTNQRIVVIQIIADERNQSLNLFVRSHFPVRFHIERFEMKRKYSAIHIDSVFNCAENQFFVDNSTTSSSIIDSLFRSLGNRFDVLFYSFLDSLTLQLWEYSECCEELLCWGLGERSTCLFTNVLYKSSNLNFTSLLLLLLFLDSISHLNMNIVFLVIKDDQAAQKKRRFEAFCDFVF